MGRVLIIAVAVLLGAASVWFFVPTVPLANVADGPAARSKAALAGQPLSAQQRRMRAENLIGQEFRYISSDEMHSTSWFTDQGAPAIERAMDECAVLADAELYLQHVIAGADSSVRDTEEDLDGIAHLKAMRPTFSQLRNCINAKIAYNQLFEAKG